MPFLRYVTGEFRRNGMPEISTEQRGQVLRSLRDARNVLTLLHYDTPFSPKPIVNETFKEIVGDEERTRWLVKMLEGVFGATLSGERLQRWIAAHAEEKTDPVFQLISVAYLTALGDDLGDRRKLLSASIIATNELVAHPDAWYVLKRFAYGVWQCCPETGWEPLLSQRIREHENLPHVYPSDTPSGR
jgi:hypothetical protein